MSHLIKECDVVGNAQTNNLDLLETHNKNCRDAETKEKMNARWRDSPSSLRRRCSFYQKRLPKMRVKMSQLS